MKQDDIYDQKYAGQEYYWGKKPSALCDRLMESIRPMPDRRPTLLDLGCGEGRNAVHLAKLGFDVTGLDASRQGLQKTQRYAEEVGAKVKVIHGDITTCEIEETYDVVFSTGTLQYLPPEVRQERFEHFKNHTSPEGIDALSCFVRKPFIPRPSDAEGTAFPYRSGELMGHYWDWEILYCVEEMFDCMSGGAPHKHALNRIIARRFS